MRIIEDRTPIDELLEEQQRLRTPVAAFSNFHDAGPAHDFEPVYRDLIPLSRPGLGEQYAFEVDMDSCTGCKACVTGCHSMNGLEEHETWRDVGLIHAREGQPYQQTITSACHHCVEPACMHGCPVLAYEKDAETGIVVHLDDQCIGCQYCVLKCPYDVPKYSEFLGIVRKCDMCHGRLQDSEAPACVQACPTSAISITIVDTSGIRESAAKGDFLTGAPAPEYTIPTTHYRSESQVPVNAVSADSETLVPEHAHFPLVAMLVFTQIAFGCFLFAQISSDNASVVTGGFVALVVGIGASVLHLGRPLGAWRAFLGLRRSWLSREIVVFGCLIPAAGLYVLSEFVEGHKILNIFRSVTLVLGLLGVFCSIMIYADTRRLFWSLKWGSIRFFGTVLIMGTASWLLGSDSSKAAVVLLVLSLFKLGIEGFQFVPGFIGKEGSAGKSARLMMGPLIGKSRTRFLMGITGGIVIPSMLLGFVIETETFRALSVLSWFLLFLGELFERILFFQAVDIPRMPGMNPSAEGHK